MRFLRQAVVIYRFLSAINALITVISQSLLAHAVLMATLEMRLDREGNHSVPPTPGCSSRWGGLFMHMGFGAARWDTVMLPAVLWPVSLWSALGKSLWSIIAASVWLCLGPLLWPGPGHLHSAVGAWCGVHDAGGCARLGVLLGVQPWALCLRCWGCWQGPVWLVPGAGSDCWQGGGGTLGVAWGLS